MVFYSLEPVFVIIRLLRIVRVSMWTNRQPTNGLRIKTSAVEKGNFVPSTVKLMQIN